MRHAFDALGGAPVERRPYRRENPTGGLRMHTCGAGRGLVVHLILDDPRRVDILQVHWVDLPRRPGRAHSPSPAA